MSTDQKGSLDQQYKTMVMRFKSLHNAQDVLAKLGHLPVGATTIETKIFAALKTLKPLINGGNALVVNANLSAVESQLREYDDWLQQSNNSLTPFGLRQYINQGMLKREEMVHYARYISSKKSDSPDDRGKLELLIAELCADAEDEERERLLMDLFPDAPPLSYSAQELVAHMRSLTAQLEALTEFPQFITGDFMARARRLKLDLGNSIWHPQALSVVGNLNQALESCFSHLFNAERRFILEACRRLLAAGINSIGKLGENGVLNVDAAMRMAEKADDLLEQNYQTNIQKLQQLAQIGIWLRNAVEMLNGQANDEEAKPAPVPRPPAERDSNLAPISTVLDYADKAALEQQVTARVEEISQILAARPRRSSLQVVQLKRTVIILSPWEVDAMVSWGNLVNAARRHHFDVIRRALALVAELQESAVVFAEGMAAMKGKRSNYQYSVPATVYFLEEARRSQGELETISQSARTEGDIEMALNLLATRSKLQDAYQKILANFREAGLDVQ